MQPLDIPRLAVGEKIQGMFLISERAEKTPQNGDPFVILTLGNCTGSICTSPVWANQSEWAEGASRGKIVQAIGQVQLYPRTGARQLALTAALRVVPNDQVVMTDFLPGVAGGCDKLWEWIDRVRSEIRSATLRRVLDLFYADEAFRLRFERTPASVGGHHAMLGGLLLHVFEVTTIARATAKSVRADLDLVTAGALLHDIGKVEAYSVSNAGFGHTNCGMLIGHVVLGAMMLERAVVKAGDDVCSDVQQMELQHIILSHHGALEYGSPVRPMTTEAEIVHWADEASAKASDMSDSLTDDSNFTDGEEISSNRPWRVGRKVWRRSHRWE